MKRIKLTREEREIENALLRGEYVSVSKAEFKEMERALARKRKELTLRKKAAEEYRAGKITISEAAHQAGITLWEMKQYLVAQGYQSAYSVEDLERERRRLK